MPSKKSNIPKAKPKKPTKEDLATAMGVMDFDKWLTAESERTGRTKQAIIEDTFKDGFLTWTTEDTEKIAGKGRVNETVSQDTLDSMVDAIRKDRTVKTEKAREEAIAEIKRKFTVTESAIAGGTVTQAPPILTAWTLPNIIDDIDELRRLRREFAPVSRAVDYVKGMILGNELDVSIEDPEDKSKKDIRADMLKWMKDVFQDQYTTSLYTLMSILLDESLTVGAAGAEIRYENSDFKFFDYVTQVNKSTLPVSKSSTPNAKDFVYFDTKEPMWSDLKGIVQLKIFKNGARRLKLYRDPNTWEANYWTLDEIVSQGDATMAISQMALKAPSGGAIRYHPWQIFWLNVNRREFDERGMSIVAPVKGIALLLEKILGAVGEGCFRAGNKKYFIICGTEKRPWSKPHIRNVMQQIQEMGKRNWTTVPVPYGFDIKEIGGNVFQANQVITILVNLLAQGMHVPTEILGILTRALGTTTGERQVSMSFNEIEQMRYEFKQAIENQLFRKQLWCTIGKTKSKQGGKGTEPVYVPELKVSTKGLMSPFDKLEQIEKLLNVANPVSPQMKLELEREMATILGYDNIDFETQEELKKELKARVGTDTSIANPLMGKTQGEPEPVTNERTQARQAGGVNKGIQGGGRVPKEQKKGIGIGETSLTQEPSQHPQHITPTGDTIDQSSVKTGGNYGPQGYATIGKGNLKGVQIKITKSGTGISTFINPLSQKEVTIVLVELYGGIAGYNKDGTIIYIDPAVPEWMYEGLICHETFEMALVEVLGFAYEWAHIQATGLERQTVENMGIDWEKYDDEYHRLLDVQEKREPRPKNPDDIHSGAHNPQKRKKAKGKSSETVNMGTRSETGDKEAPTPAMPEHGKPISETHVIHDVNINVKTEPLKIEQGKSEVVIVETTKPEVEKALSDLKTKQEETTKKLASVSKEIKDKMELTTQENDTFKKAKIDMEIANLEAERRKIEAERITIEETAKKKQELMKEIEKKIKESE